jgi:hypothetical protein
MIMVGIRETPAPCRYCDGSGYFYSDPDFGPCSCAASPEPAETITRLAKELGCEDDPKAVFRAALARAKSARAGETP